MSTTTLQSPQLSQPQVGYTALPLAAVRWLEHAGISLFACDLGSEKPSVLCGKSVQLSQERMERLIQDGAKHAYVRRSELDRVARALRADLDEILANESTGPEERVAVLQVAAASEIDGSFRLIDCDRYVAVALRFGKLIARLAIEHELDAHKLFQLVWHDERKCSRVPNVAAYCGALAKQLGIQGEAELEQVTVGAMLYDIGERFVPEEILSKNGPLTNHEWGIVEQHPRTGFLNLLEFEVITEGQRLMAYQHHERINGHGYPVHLTGDEIHPWAKMLAVVDVFDAATGSRPYRKPLELPEALDILRRNAGTLFDEEIVECWTKNLTP